jgi:baseplate J-like protein
MHAITPLPTANRPALPTLSYRVGTHSAFLETMKARLSGRDYPQLAGLTSREPNDGAIALLDAWATVGDVLTFYQERIANEGYLRTATERRSVLELARLVGYRPRPGVSASGYLAYTIDDKFTEEALIPAGSRAQSVPGPGETAESFETREDLKARAKWNNLRPRLTEPQTRESIRCGDHQFAQIYLKGITTNLKPNDPLLIDLGVGPELFRVRTVTPDLVANRTRVLLRERAACPEEIQVVKSEGRLIDRLVAPPSVPPASARQLVRTLSGQFGTDTPAIETGSLLGTLGTNEAGYSTAKVLAPALRNTLTSAAANADVTGNNPIRVYALRVKASLFGHNAPKQMKVDDGEISIVGDWPIIEETGGNGATQLIAHEEELVIQLDGRFDAIVPDGGPASSAPRSWIVVETPDTRLTSPIRIISPVVEADAGSSRSDYGISGPTTRITVETKWITIAGSSKSTPTSDDFQALRRTVVYAQSEPLELAEAPIGQPVCGGERDLIELDGFYEDLEAGRWVVVSGEREIAGTSGVRFSELSMLSSVSHDVRRLLVQSDPDGPPALLPRSGETTHTFIKLDKELAYCFKRDTVRIHGNVAAATHGETRNETLGSGAGSHPLQQFVLKQSPLTFVAGDNPSGIDSTLKVYVSDVQWREAETFVGLGPSDRRFVTRTDDDGKVTVVFGNGREGARLPTGIENVKAVYRTGIGRPGNVKAEQITLLATRPLGAKEVVNPLPASGGADRETRDQARKNVPLAVMALDRLVSVQDYEDFARVFAGVGKARAAELSDGRRLLLHLTIAGVDDIPIEKSSDLYRHLTLALRRFGDPDQAIRLEVRELLLLVLSARVRVHPDYQWEKVEPLVRAALLDAFSFDRRELGEDALLSVATSVIQHVAGVEWVDVDAFDGIPERISNGRERVLLDPGDIAKQVRKIVQHAETAGPRSRVRVNLAGLEDGQLRPAQIAYLTPFAPATLILNEAPR